MSHEVENMISTKGIVPWHNLGVVVPDQLVTAEEIIRQIGFDFYVDKRQNSTNINRDGKEILVALNDSYSTIRVNKDGSKSVLSGRVGRNYTPIQNVDAFAFFDNVVGKGEAIYETAGILKQGKAVFLLASLPDYIKVLGNLDDQIKQYVLLANWHDGTSCLLAMFTDVRVCCNNTLNMALTSAQSQVAIRHTPVAEERMKEAVVTMGLVNQYNQEMEKAFNQMALTKVTSDDIGAYIESLFPTVKDATDRIAANAKERRETVMALVENGHGAKLDTSKGTAWGMYNAVAEYIDHGTNFRTDDARASSLLIGAGRQLKQKAFDQALLIGAYKNSTKYSKN